MFVLAIYIVYITYIILYLKVDVALCWTTEHVYAILTLILSLCYIKRVIGKKENIVITITLFITENTFFKSIEF